MPHLVRDTNGLLLKAFLVGALLTTFLFLRDLTDRNLVSALWAVVLIVLYRLLMTVTARTDLSHALFWQAGLLVLSFMAAWDVLDIVLGIERFLWLLAPVVTAVLWYFLWGVTQIESE